MNFSNPRFEDPFLERGCKGTLYFLTSKLFRNFFQKNLSEVISSVSLLKNSPLSGTPFSIGIAKVLLFVKPAIPLLLQIC